MLTINPIAVGAFKIAVDPVYDMVTDEDEMTDDDLRPVHVRDHVGQFAPDSGQR